MKKTIKRFFLLLIIGLIVILGTLSLVAEFFEDQIGERLVKEVNKQIKSELAIQEFDLSIIRSFPNLSANLKEVILEDSRDGVLLEAEELSFRLGLLSALSSNLKFKSLIIRDGALNIDIDRRGNANYEIFESTEEESSNETAISLNTAILEDVELIYSDEQAKQAIRMLVENADFSGKLSSKKFALKSKASIQSDFIEIDDKRYFSGKDLGYKANVLVDMENGFYDFQELILEIASNTFSIDGTVKTEEDKQIFDLHFIAEDGNMESVIQLLPEEYLEYLGDFRSSGDFLFSGNIDGEATASQGPKINFELSLENGRINSPRLDKAFKDVSFLAKYSNGKDRNNATSSFEIQDLKGYFNRELIELKLRVNNFDEPYIDFLLDGVLPLEPIHGLFNNPSVTDGHGEIEIKNLTLKGRYKDMIRPSRIYRVETGGDLEFDDAGFTVNGEKMLFDRGDLIIENNLLSIKDLKLEGAGSEMEFNGSANNLIPVLFADSQNSQRAALEFEANLLSKNMDMDRLMKLSALYGVEETVSEAEYDTLAYQQLEKREYFTQFLKGAFNATIENFNYNKIIAEAFNGKLGFENNSLIIEGRTQAMDGDFDLEGRLFFEASPRLKAKLLCNNINVTEFFAQTENFGQDVLVDENVQGTLQAQILINAYWDEYGNYLDDQLHVMAGVAVENGQLVKFKMLEDFSTYVNVKDLRRIKFVNMENYFEVTDNTLYIPAMFIQSNALNLTFSGSHSFENEIDYNLKVNAGQVLANRFKSHDSSLKPKKARRRGFFNLHYNISGTMEDFIFESNKKRVKSDFESSEIVKRRVRRALAQEFDQISLVEDHVEWEDASGSSEEDEFLDWEEEGGNN